MGSGRSPSPYSIDDGYKTPTLLGTLETPPYFHDGRFRALADVVAWFDASFDLKLTAGERGDLTAYLEAVGASEKLEDDRSIALQMVDTFVYLLVWTQGGARADRAVWRAALNAARRELRARPTPTAVQARTTEALTKLDALRAQTDGATNEKLAEMRRDIVDLHRSLVRLAADWAGAAASEGR